MNLKPTNTNKFEKTVRTVQITLAGIVGSTILAIWASYWTVTSQIFAPKPSELSDLRINIAKFALYLTCGIGIGSIIWLIQKFVEFKQNYNELIELKKKQDKEDQEQ